MRRHRATSLTAHTRWIASYLIARYYLRKPEYAHFIYRKFPSYRTIFMSLVNELAYKLGLLRVTGPNTIVFELTNKCNIACTFCPVNHGMLRPKGFLTFEIYQKVLDENPQVKAVNLCHWGEPLLHEQLAVMVGYASRKKINTTFFTNGILLTEPKTDELIAAGLSELVFSVEGDAESHQRLRGFKLTRLEEIIRRTVEKRNLAQSQMKISISMVVGPETESLVDSTRSKWQDIVDDVYLQPLMDYAGGQRTQKCRELWRGSLVVLWDGRVVPCGVDYEGTLELGNAHHQTLRSILNGPQMRRLRRLHRRKDFEGICRLCSEWRTDQVAPRYH
jgi:radical SAM protein with 4Fe4S-binding SPASM domain